MWLQEAHQTVTIIVTHKETVLEHVASLIPGGADEEDGWVISIPHIEDVWPHLLERKLQARDQCFGWGREPLTTYQEFVLPVL